MPSSSLVPRNNGGSSPIPWDQSNGYYPQPTQGGAGMREQLVQALDLVVRRKVIFAVCFLLTLTAIMAYTFITEPTYEARAWVMIDLEESSSSVPSVSGYTENVQFVRRKRSLEGELLLLEISNPLAGRVAERLVDLGVVPGTTDSLGILTTDSGARISRRSVARRLKNYVKFTPEGKEANIIRITARSPIAGEAALIANMYSEEYVRLTQEANRAHLSASRRLLEAQEEKWRVELYGAEEAVRSSGSFEGSASLDQRGSFLVSQIAQLEAQRDQTNIDLQMHRSSLASIEDELLRVNPQIADRIASSVDQQIEGVRNRISELEMERKEILLRYPNVASENIDHPGLRTIEQQLVVLRSDLADLSKRYVEEVESTGGLVGSEGLAYVAELRRKAAEERIVIQGMEGQLQTIERRLQSNLADMGRLPLQSLQVARLERTRQHATQMYESVVSRLQEVLVAEQSETGYARLIREAGVPGSPADPDVTNNLLLGLLLGILVGVVSGIVSDKIDNRLYRPDTVDEAGYDVIGIVPDMEPLVKSEWKGRKSVTYDDSEVSPYLVGLVSPSSAATEAYRHVRTHIQFSGKERVIRRILVTSASMGEGKSVTASNLALVMAQAGRRTILIDADLRRPRVGTLFGMEYEVEGLAELLSGSTTLADIESKQDFDKLTVVPAGGAVDRPSELLGSRALRDLLERLETDYDVVIIDSPPVRAATDAVLLSTQCDGTLVVARAAVTKEPELELAVKELNRVGANVLGVLFNAFDLKMAYGYSYMYSRYADYSTYSTYQRPDQG